MKIITSLKHSDESNFNRNSTSVITFNYVVSLSNCKLQQGLVTTREKRIVDSAFLQCLHIEEFIKTFVWSAGSEKFLFNFEIKNFIFDFL